MKKYLLKYFDEDLIDIVLSSHRYKRIIGSSSSMKGQKEKVNINIASTLYEKYKLPMYKIYYIQWGSKKDINSIFDYMYSDKKDLYLVRKYNKIKNRPSI